MSPVLTSSGITSPFIFPSNQIRMTPSHAVKNGVRYRYYISSALIQGQPDKAATLNRVPAAEIETLIISALRKHFARESNNKAEAQGSRSLNDKDLISTYIARVDVKPDHLAVRLSVKPDQRSGERHQELSSEGGTLDHSDPNIMLVPLAEDAVKTAAWDHSPRRNIFSSGFTPDPSRDPRPARHSNSKGPPLAR